jgi:hypothetical protein
VPVPLVLGVVPGSQGQALGLDGDFASPDLVEQLLLLAGVLLGSIVYGFGLLGLEEAGLY